MKNVLYFLLFILTSCQLFEFNQKQDYILAGDSHGLREVKYNPPVELVYTGSPTGSSGHAYPQTFRIDLNNDSSEDIMLVSDGGLSHGGDYRIAYISSLNSNTYIALASDSLFVKKLELADTINAGLTWSNEQNSKFILSTYESTYSNPGPTINGEWISNYTKYFGVYLEAEKEFAYCKLSVQNYKDITLYSYAIQR